MNKQRFIKILNNYHNIPEEEIPKLQQLIQDYPFSQIIYCLIAKATHDAGLDDAPQKINQAALYTTDRKVLKNLMASKGEPAQPVADTPEQPTTLAKPSESFTTTIPSGEADDLRDEVMRNLALLMESKKPYTSTKEEVAPSVEEAPVQEPVRSTQNGEPAEKRQQEEEKLPTVADILGQKDTRSASNAKLPKPEPFSINRQREQIDIIDRFISADPSIRAKVKPGKTPSKPQVDLSESSGAFGEDLVSETLAKILVQQGKTNKAIDIYKKLIWKYPQKKAYFASLIEALKS